MSDIVIAETPEVPRYYVVCSYCSPNTWFWVDAPLTDARCQTCGEKMDLVDTEPEWPEEL